MHIQKVELKDFKRHKHFVCEFTRGTNAICGPNGAGKTSVIEAIGFALFNASASKKMTEMIRRNGRKMEIHIDFEASADERLYRVIRTLTQSNSSTFRILDLELNQIVATDQKECLETLSNLMDLHPSTDLRKLFSDILGVPQGTMTSAFLGTDAERRSIFGPLLRVDEYEKASKEMNPLLLSGMRERLASLRGKIEQNKERLLRLPSLREELLAQQAQVAAHEKEHGTLKQELSQKKQQLAQLEEQEKILHAFESKLKKSREEVIRLDESVKRTAFELEQSKEARALVEQHQEAFALHGQAQEEQKQLLGKQKLYQKLHQTLQERRNEVQAAVLRGETLREQLTEQEEATRRLVELEPRVEDYRLALREREQLDRRFIALQEIRKQIPRLEEQLAVQLSRCEALQRDLLSLPEVEEKVTELRSLTEQGTTEGQRLADLERQKQRREEAIQKLEQLRAELEEIEREGKAIKQQSEELDLHLKPRADKLAHWQDESSRCNEEITRLQVKMEREEDFQAGVSGGVCPFFEQRCRNLQQGQDLREFLTGNVERYKQELVVVQEQYKLAREETKLSQEAQNEYSAKKSGLEERRNELRRQLRARREEVSLKEKELAEMPDVSEDIEAVQRFMEGLRERFRQLKPFEDTHRSLVAKQGELQAAEQQRKVSEAYLAQQKSDVQEMLDVEETLPALREKIEGMGNPEIEAGKLRDLSKKRAKTQQDVEQIEAQLAKLQKDCDGCEQELAALGEPHLGLERVQTQLEETRASYEKVLSHRAQAARVEEREATLAKQKADLAALEAEIAQVEASLGDALKDFDREALETLRQEHDSLAKRFHNLEGLLKPERRRLEDIGNQVAELVTLESQQSHLEGEFSQWNESMECCVVLRRVIKDAGPIVTRALITSISKEANRIFREITQRGELQLTWDENFLAQINEGGYERGFANLSGGEQMAVALAIRLALIRELSDVRIAFFDEPTAHMDQERRHGLARMISSVSDFDQLFVISHDDTFESMTDHYVYVDYERNLRAAS